MFKRLRTLWKLSDMKDITLTPEQLRILKKQELERDGRAEFLGEGSLEEFEEQTKKDKGLWNLWPRK